ncbi:branched-chain amino acid transport system permease protein [Ruminococcus sp. YE71]|uniref:branched-chain amino acid ABC transporter permease n=1 Tax=unclassified Ruminococcus TaxID=2608920 RepID=UPI0008912539|nr:MULTISPECIES: branched-chain amino acid ABC transporter permease [unclassified Ruminococcus]SDA27400.1 branched-chain amino acid transport system permease protein [Ruminococcus sp. YE78]SFW45122.1 branched-chain amino acid transport system permease protein [Ruminococcus sp. YE71]
MKLKIKPATRRSFVTYAIVTAAFIAVEVAASLGRTSNMFIGLLIPFCVYSIAAVSLNLTVGILGELSLGQAGFMCIGAYSSAIFSCMTKDTITNALVRFPMALLVGGAFAAIFGVLIGIPVLRLRGDYLAIVTLAFGEIIKNVFAALYVGKDSRGLHFSLTSSGDLGLEPGGKMIINGALGISGIPKDSTFEIGFVVLMLTLVIIYNFINSRTGRAVMSIRDNRIAAESIGLNITKYKLITFGLTAFLAGIAGALFSHNLAILQASKFDYNLSILILVFVVLGGIGSVRGSVIAAVVLTYLPEVLRSINSYRMLIYSIVLIVMMIFTSNAKIRGFFAGNLMKLKAMFGKQTAAKEGE